jgi:hypothetical protein
MPDWPVSERDGEAVNVGTVHGRQLVRLAGTLRWNAEGAGVLVSSCSDQSVRRFGLRGTLRRFEFLDREVFVGVPAVMDLGEDGQERIIARECVELRLAGPGARWSRASEFAGFGTVRLRVVEGGETVFTTNLTLVPPDFRIELDAGPTDGRVRTSSRELRSVHAASNRPHTVLPRTAATHELAFVAGDVLPEPVELSFRFAEGEFRAHVPFPARFLSFTDRKGKAIPTGAPLSARALSGLHARYLAAGSAGREIVDVEARVGGGSAEYVGQLVDSGSGSKDLHLEAIRERLELLLASGDDSDDELQLALGLRGGVYSQRQRITLRRYDAYLDKEGHEDRAVLTFRKMQNAFGDFEALRLQAVPLWQPNGDVELLESLDEGRWVFHYAARKTGPWLITGWVGNSMCMRPLRVTVPGTASEHVRARMEEAVRTPERAARGALFQQLCGDLARSWNHQEWAGMDEFLGTLGAFPAHTFEAVRELTSHPGAAILALLRAPSVGELSQRWRGFEELPFSWFLQPLGGWMLAGIALREEAVRGADACKAEGIKGDWGVARLVNDLLAPIGAAHLPPFVATIREMWARLLADFPPVTDGMLTRTGSSAQLAFIAQGIVEDLTNEMLNRHADDTLPQAHLEEVSKKVHEVAETLFTRWWSAHQVGFRRDVLQTPVVAAAIMFLGERPSDQTIRTIRRLRSFDEDWFDQVHAWALTVMVSENLSRDPDFLDKLAGL